MIKTAEAYFYEFRASADTDAAMSLLRSRDALLHLALMAAHLGEGQIVDGQSLAALIGGDLAGLGPVRSRAGRRSPGPTGSTRPPCRTLPS